MPYTSESLTAFVADWIEYRRLEIRQLREMARISELTAWIRFTKAHGHGGEELTNKTRDQAQDLSALLERFIDDVERVIGRGRFEVTG